MEKIALGKRDIFRKYPDLVDVNQLCRMLNISSKTAYRMLKAGTIQSFRIGHSYRIPKIHVINYLSNGEADVKTVD